MNRLCDEVLQIVFNDLDDPTALTRVSKRFHCFSQDPYIRASYFLRRYGKIQALYYAFGRGRLMNERVIDILLTSGAHLSRYLMQTAMHHYFRSFAPFIKTPWVRSISLPVFTHLLGIATKLYGNIPVNKGDDDGSIFNEFLRESRYPAEMKHIKWDEIKDIVEKYKFIPFCNKDPIMAQFPLALAIEPRLLPLAVTNGFSMDSKYRDFIFRKMFEKPTLTSEGHMDDIIKHVRELTKLDSRMFLSRTVAAEVCMEAKTNESAYKALKKLDESGDLLFELGSLVEELIKLFANTRYITSSHTVGALTQLYHDFPSSDPTVRLVLLLGVFINDITPLSATPARLKSKLEPLGVLPITRQDIFNVLINPFVEKYQPILEFARVEVGLKQKDVDRLVEEVAIRCLEEGCKGKMLRRLYDTTRGLHDVIVNAVLQRFRLDIDDLPSWEDEDACHSYSAPLCRDFTDSALSDNRVDEVPDENSGEAGDDNDEDGMFVDEDGNPEVVEQVQLQKSTASHDPTPELGHIGQDTLSTMIRQDESTSRYRRRFYDVYISSGESLGKLRYPQDPMPVGRWISNQFGDRSVITAIFMIHGVINDNSSILSHYLCPEDSSRLSQPSTRVPVTLKHFKMLARLGRAPAWHLIADIEKGAEFFFSEEDYLTPEQLNGTSEDSKRPKSSRIKVKAETQPTSLATSTTAPFSSPSSLLSAAPGFSTLKVEHMTMKGRKRLRRSAASTVKSYVVPDSDDEAIVDEKPDVYPWGEVKKAKQRKVESNLQRWIKHLTSLQKEEQKKYKEKKKRMERNAPPGIKVRVVKSEFLKTISQSLRDLRKADQVKRQLLYGPGVADEDYSEGEDDEYVFRTSRGKRRRVE